MSVSDEGLYNDWTKLDGRSNSSPTYLELVAAVEDLIRHDAHALLAGRADQTARLIVAHLAHKHGMVPRNEERLTLIAHALRSVICCESGDFTLYDRLLDMGVPIDRLLEDAWPLSVPPYSLEDFHRLMDMLVTSRS